MSVCMGMFLHFQSQQMAPHDLHKIFMKAYMGCDSFSNLF